jgi:LPS-assembly lipoprotein
VKAVERRAVLRGALQGLMPVLASHWMARAGARWAVAGGAAAALGGCGFALRGATALDFSRLQLVGVSPASPLGQELRRQLGGRVQLVDSAAQADVVLTFEGAQREKGVTGLTAAGLVRELALRLRIRFSLATAQGRVLIGPTDLLLQRDMATNESAALAKAREEDEIFRVLERDMVLQIVRRLESVRLAPSATPAARAGPGAGAGTGAVR